MASRGQGSGTLARLRMPVQQAEAALERLGTAGEERDALVFEALVDAADPPAALNALDRLAHAHFGAWERIRDDDRLLKRVTRVCGVSDALGDVLVAAPDALDVLADDLQALDADAVRRLAGSAIDETGAAWSDPVHAASAHADQAQVAAALAGAQRRGLLRIAARDVFGFVDTMATAAELADLAAGIVAAALDHLLAAGPPVRMAVIGMGKLGGAELNYVSDIDVLFVHEGDRAAGERTAARLLTLLGTMTPLGVTYDVDANLRPEGRDGPLVRTVDSYDAYYQRWARTWEQQALMKARPIAGDADLAGAFMTMVEPYVWPDRRPGETVVDIQKMKGVVESSAPVRRAGTREVKLAPGGLRDIEFAVQLLQLVHGRHDDRLRSPNTVQALAALARWGYVDDGDANLFGDAYGFLRTVEHRLQLRRLRRTHVIPDDDGERYRLARACGFRDLRTASALDQFDRELSRVRSAVRRLHEKLFYRPLLDRFAEVSGADARVVGGGSVSFDDTAAVDRLAALGFTSPGRSMGHLRALATGTNRADVLIRNALPTLLPTLADGPDPDGGLLGLRTMAERLEHAPSFLRALRDAPPVGQMLASVLSRSRLVGEWLERQPEVFGTLADASAIDEPIDADDFARVAHGLVRRGGDDARIADALRRFKRREVARIAVRDLTGRADPQIVASELTGLADACLSASVEAITAGTDVQLAVLGLGKLGGRELGYGSDLDIIVAYEPRARRDEAMAAVERLLALLSNVTPEGQAFAVDLKLRPEGKDGPLTRTVDSTLEYYRRWGRPWELFALTQARLVAGSPKVGTALLDGLQPLVWPEAVTSSYLREIRTMKARIERERSSGSKARGIVDVKLGHGGLSDIEWTVQLLSVRHGHDNPALRQPGVLAPMVAAVECGALSGEESVWLRHGWSVLTHLRNARYLAGARRTDEVPLDAPSLEHIAAMLGYDRPGAQALGEELARVMRRVRRVHERRFYG